MVWSLFREIHLLKQQCQFHVFSLWFQRRWYAFQLLIVSELFPLLSWNCKCVEVTLFWIPSRIAIVDLTARDTATKSFISFWSAKHKTFVTDNISSRNVVWNTVQEINKFYRQLTYWEFEFFEIISSRERTICSHRSLTLLHACPYDHQDDETVNHMLVVIRKKYGELVSYSEMFSIILKVICLFQIPKRIYLLNV